MTVRTAEAKRRFSAPKVRLIEAAEELFGEHGIEGISLRRVAEQAGQKNVNAAQYHFGSREGLLKAILDYRRPQVDEWRRQYLEDRNISADDGDIRLIIFALAVPLLQQPGRTGRQARSFCRFQRSLHLFDAYNAIWNRSQDSAPVTTQLYRSLRRQLPHLPEREWIFRVNTLGRLMVSMICDFDSFIMDTAADRARFLSELVGLNVAGFTAPFDPVVDADIVEAAARISVESDAESAGSEQRETGRLLGPPLGGLSDWSNPP